MQKIHSLVFIFGIRGWVIWLEGWGFKKVSGTDSHSVGVLEGAPGLRLYLKGLREGLLGVKQSFPGEQGFVGEAWVLKNNHPISAAFRKVYLPLCHTPRQVTKPASVSLPHLLDPMTSQAVVPGRAEVEDRKWGSSGPSPRVAQVTSAYIHPIDTDSLPWPQLQRSWDPWLSCVPEGS